MKVILKSDIEKLGYKDEVKEVAAGYARNFLIPKGLVVMATDSELKQLAHRQMFDDRRQKKIELKLAQMAEKIKGSELVIKANAGEEGKLFGSIGVRQIAEALSAYLKIDIDRKRVMLENPLKSLGDHNVVVDLGGSRKVEIVVKVVPEQEPASSEPEAAPEQAAPAAEAEA